ncbi:MAG: gamma-glutamyltransferase family protein [Planctomycetota bacterium]
MRHTNVLVRSIVVVLLATSGAAAQRTAKPVLHGRHWMAITGKPLGATAGATIFARGGNAVDAACAMLGATCTMWDTLGWGGETQALIYDPVQRKVVGINALGVAPTGATAEYFRRQDMTYPPAYGPLAAVTPGTPGGLMVMLAEYGTMSLAEVLAPSMEMADGYPIEAQTADRIEREKDRIREWPYSRDVFLTHQGEPPREQGGLITLEDLSDWEVYIERPVMTTYKGIEVYKLTTWVQGPVLLQMLNMLEPVDLRGLGYNSARYIHTVYQVMNLAFADRDFYYGDPYFPPDEPVAGLLSKDYARQRFAQVDPDRNDAVVGPGDPYPFQGGENPYREHLERWSAAAGGRDGDEVFHRGTTSIQAADAAGWVVSVTPSGAWVPAVIAGRTGIGMSQRMQSFVTDPAENPFNVVEPGKRPRATLTPSIAMKDGEPFLSFAVQGGDAQDQNLLQFFLNVVEFGMNVQEAAEAANVNSYQMRGSFGEHESRPGRMLIHESVPPWVRSELESMGYSLTVRPRTSGPINAIWFDREHGGMWGGSSDHGEDYGIAW